MGLVRDTYVLTYSQLTICPQKGKFVSFGGVCNPPVPAYDSFRYIDGLTIKVIVKFHRARIFLHLGILQDGLDYLGIHTRFQVANFNISFPSSCKKCREIQNIVFQIFFLFFCHFFALLRLVVSVSRLQLL